MAKIIAITNQKGGVGKTTTALNTAAGLAIAGYNTLVIDLDPQGNASTGLGIAHQKRDITIYNILMQQSDIEKAIIDVEGIPKLSIISANNNLAGAEIELSNLNISQTVLREALKTILANYCYIIIDCPPALGLLTINALIAANEVLIPMQCEFFSLEGLSNLLNTIKSIKKSYNPSLIIKGILLTMYDRRNALTSQVESDVRNMLQDLVFKTVIPRNIKLSEAPSYGKPGIIYDLASKGALAYIEFIKEILHS